MIGNSICFGCTRFTKFDADHPTAYCSAFPDGIPDAILVSGFDHRHPYAGDKGILFEADKAKADKTAAYEAIVKLHQKT